MPYPQPALNSDQGVILTVGLVTGFDRWAIVLPMATDNEFEDKTHMPSDCLDAFVATSLPQLLACLSEHTAVTYIQAEGMVDGMVPHRFDYAMGVNVGTRAGTAMPSQVSALAVYYVDPAQTLSTGRERVAKNFIGGLSASDVAADIIADVVVSAIETFADNLAQGINDPPNLTLWYRVGKAIRATGQALPNIVVTVARDYVVTQRRRLIPRG